MGVGEILIARGGTHGVFKDSAIFVQYTKKMMDNTPNWDSLSPDKKEALHMIQHKIGRILHGNANFKDHWEDILGYTQLVIDELED